MLPQKPAVPVLSKEDLLRLSLIVAQYDHNPHYRELADKLHALIEDSPESVISQHLQGFDRLTG